MKAPIFTRPLDESASAAKTAIYARVASADDWAIESQERFLLTYAENNGYGQCVCYRDNGESGVTLNRPALRDMFLDIESGVIGTVIVKDLSRLSRNYWELDELVSLMTAKNVLLISVSDGGVVNGTDGSLTEVSRALRLLVEQYTQA